MVLYTPCGPSHWDWVRPVQVNVARSLLLDWANTPEITWNGSGIRVLSAS